MSAASESARSAAINMTPFIDVVLVLLVIVLTTAHIAARSQRGMAATLPKATSGEVLTAPRIISVLNDGRLFIDRQPIDAVALQTALSASPPAKGQVVLEVEPQVPHQRVIEILDALAKAGVTDAAFATERRVAP